MINGFEFYHGAVFSKLIHENYILSIVPYPTESNASYVMNKNIGLYIKYSTKRLSPWRFTFKKDHQDEILDMKKILGMVFIFMVCKDDGIACLDFSELKMVLDQEHGSAEWIAVHRRPRGQYSVKGSDGKLKFKIGMNDFSKISSIAT